MDTGTEIEAAWRSALSADSVSVDFIDGASWLRSLVELRSDGEWEEKLYSSHKNNCALLDEIIAFFGSVHLCYYEEMISGSKDRSRHQDIAITKLCGSGAHYLQSIKILSQEGLDVSCKALVRVWLEHLQLLSIVLSEDVAEEFNGAESPEEANKFWHKHLSKGKSLRRAALAVLRDQLENSEEWWKSLREWEDEELKILGAAIHPSSIGSFMASAVNGKNGNALGGFVGGIQSSQFRTFSFIFHETWFFLKAHNDFPFGTTKGALSENNVLASFSKKSGEVITKILTRYVMDPDKLAYRSYDDRLDEQEGLPNG